MHGPDTVIRAIELQMKGPKGLIGPTPNGGDAAGINDCYHWGSAMQSQAQSPAELRSAPAPAMCIGRPPVLH